ncbi:PDC sensor domain-containing protein [Roseomonas sp. GCM10028921]
MSDHASLTRSPEARLLPGAPGGALNPRGSSPAPRGGRHVPRPTLSGLLLLLLLAVLLPTLVFGAVASRRAVQGQQAAAEARLRDSARALALAVDRELGRQAAALAAFAAHPAFGPAPSSPDLAALDRHARSMAQRLGQQMFVAREDGELILSTRLPLGARLPRTTAQNLIDRVFTTGRPALSNLMVGAISGAKLLTVSVPVPDPRGGVALTAGPRCRRSSSATSSPRRACRRGASPPSPTAGR